MHLSCRKLFTHRPALYSCGLGEHRPQIAASFHADGTLQKMPLYLNLKPKVLSDSDEFKAEFIGLGELRQIYSGRRHRRRPGRAFVPHSGAGKTGELTMNPMWQHNACRMIQRRSADAGIETYIGNTFSARPAHADLP